MQIHERAVPRRRCPINRSAVIGSLDSLAGMHSVIRSPTKGIIFVLPRRVAHNAGEDKMTIKIIPNENCRPAGKLADAELHFDSADGVLESLKLIGFAIWERRGGGRNVTFPARQYSLNGERRSFALLRPLGEPRAHYVVKGQCDLSALVLLFLRRKSQSAVLDRMRERSVHSRTPVLLTFSVRLPSTTATGRWRERGRTRK
jgi:hypothetical protein